MFKLKNINNNLNRTYVIVIYVKKIYLLIYNDKLYND